MQLVQKHMSHQDTKTGQALTLVSEEITRLDGLVKDLLLSGEMGCLHHDKHEMKTILEQAAEQAVNCLGMGDTVKVEFTPPISRDAVSADYKMFLWAWVTLVSNVLKWTGPVGAVSFAATSFEQRNSSKETPRKLLAVQVYGRKQEGEVVWDYAPNLEESLCGESGDPSLKLARAVIERHGGQIELGLESRESAVVQVVLPVATDELCKQGHKDTKTRRGKTHGG
jgi:K+-sensing histidine kinase KdpD